MDNSRMNTADMLQYCNEALAWKDFGPVDIFFFESVKRILLGQCSPYDLPEDEFDDLMGIERPVRDVELEPDYHKYADIFYGEEGDDDIPDYYSETPSSFGDEIFSDGFFVTEGEILEVNELETENSNEKNESSEAKIEVVADEKSAETAESEVNADAADNSEENTQQKDNNAAEEVKA